MGEFFVRQFAPSNIAAVIFWALMLYVVSRLWWKFNNRPLDKRKELAFFALSSITAFVVLLAFAYVMTPKAATPNLSASIDRVNSGSMPTNPPALGPSYIIVVVSIRNTGAPSIAEAFTLNAHLTSTAAVPGQLTALPDQFVLKYDNGATETLFAKDSLDSKGVAGIPPGGMVRGYLCYLFPTIPLQTLTAPGVKLELGFADVFGKHYAAYESFTGPTVSVPLAFPGMDRSLDQPCPVPQPTPPKTP